MRHSFEKIDQPTVQWDGFAVASNPERIGTREDFRSLAQQEL